MSTKYSLKSFANGDNYYKSIDYGIVKDIYLDSKINSNLYKYNLKVQNYYLQTPRVEQKKVTFVRGRSKKITTM